jgi:lysophospholipase L1-like esterase
MKKLLLICVCLAPLAAHAFVNLAMAPISRMDLPWWSQRFEQSLQSAKGDPNARVVWLGDSITQYWQREGTQGYDDILPVWLRYYAPYDALDFGFVGDTTANLIWRLEHGQVAGLHPKVAIILIGANNLGRVHADLPGAHILLLGVLPSIRSAWVDANTVAINNALRARYAGDPVVTFVDVSPVLMRDGHVDASLYVDPREVPPRPALHPDAAGMAKIAAFIQPDVQRYAQ